MRIHFGVKKTAPLTGNHKRETAKSARGQPKFFSCPPPHSLFQSLIFCCWKMYVNNNRNNSTPPIFLHRPPDVFVLFSFLSIYLLSTVDSHVYMWSVKKTHNSARQTMWKLHIFFCQKLSLSFSLLWNYPQIFLTTFSHRHSDRVKVYILLLLCKCDEREACEWDKRFFENWIIACSWVSLISSTSN